VLLALAAFEPIMYATHEALHLEANAAEQPDLAAPRVVGLVGMALQLQNLDVMRFAHLFHHRMGRYGAGWAPDITPMRPTIKERARYYVGLAILPAIAWQAACLVRLLLPLSLQPHLTNIGYREKVSAKYLGGMVLTVAFATYFTVVGGAKAFIIYWLAMSCLWCLQQNIAHYGLKGFDPVTDRLCAHTYYLPRPWSWITYGSTAHFLHHADMTIPADRLYDAEELTRVENRLGLTVVAQHGLWPYIRDVLRQWRGPVPVDELSSAWAAQVIRPAPARHGAFAYRRGRTYASINGRPPPRV
jgi:fatty acid desaturase